MCDTGPAYYIVLEWNKSTWALEKLDNDTLPFASCKMEINILHKILEFSIPIYA